MSGSLNCLETASVVYECYTNESDWHQAHFPVAYLASHEQSTLFDSKQSDLNQSCHNISPSLKVPWFAVNIHAHCNVTITMSDAHTNKTWQQVINSLSGMFIIVLLDFTEVTFHRTSSPSELFKGPVLAFSKADCILDADRRLMTRKCRQVADYCEKHDTVD